MTSTSSPTLAPNAPAPSAPRAFVFDQRYIAPIFITLILLVAQWSFGVLESYSRTALAITASIATEIVLSRLLRGTWPHLASAYISGISVGILIRSPEIWPYVLCSVIAVTSKYVITVKGRHIWNPSNFSISAMVFLAPFAVSTLSVQWDNRLWAMLIIWTLGSIIVWRLKRFHICATYVAAFLVFAALRTLWTGHTFWSEVAPITGPMYQLFIFFMITDPKTTVGSKRAQCVVVVLIAAMESLLRLNQNIHAPYFALFLVGPVANLVDIWLTEKRLKLAPVVAEMQSPMPREVAAGT